MSQLSPEQITQVVSWAAEGANLNQVQDRLKSEFGITLTYLEARLLMVDVGVRLQDKHREPAKPESAAEPLPESPPEDDELPEDLGDESDFAGDLPVSTVTLSADKITIPGALISGKVTFSDGQLATWYLDQMGRLGLSGAPQGYQPPKEDIPEFQNQLDLLMQRAGF
jgi:hypothetical protein